MNIVSIERMPRVGDADELLLAFDSGQEKIARVSQVSILVCGGSRKPREYAVVKALKELATDNGCKDISAWLEAQSYKAGQLLSEIP